MNLPLASMTGYARAAGSAEAHSFTIDMKSVNARGLDLRLRLPSGMDGLEPGLRALVSSRLGRGSVSLTLNVVRDGAGAEVVVNQQALDTIIYAMGALAERVEAERPRLDGILGLKGVLESRETALPTEAEARFHETLLKAAEQCLNDLIGARRQEGEQLAALLSGHVDEIERLTAAAEADPSRDRAVVLSRLRGQIADLTEDANNNLSEERLHQEAMLLATKADIREELDRLVAHVHAARKLLATGGPIGRKLDFLAQEFNREANTLCSKSHAVELTAIGLDLKAVIDQLREQIQNLE